MYDINNYGWCHYTCVNWITDIWFADDSRTSVDGRVHPDRFKFACMICRSSTTSGTCCI